MQQRTINMWQTRINTCVRFFAVIVFFAVFAIFGAQTALAQDYYDSLSYNGWSINQFDAEIVVHEDATVTVVETIEASFDPYWNKHGIYREIPVRYRDQLYNAVNMDLEVISVLQDGEPANYTVNRSGNDISIKIGDADKTVEYDVVYQITYKVGRAFLYFDDRDELYWNVTGDDWDAPIYDVTAVVILPDGTEIIDTACYTGYEGSTAQNCGSAQEDEVIAFAADDFLTIAVGFEKGVIYEPTVFERIFYFLSDNWTAAFPLLIAIGAFLFWWRFGKDPRMETVIAEYEPPEGIWAAYAGIIASNKFTTQQITAMIIQLATKGYLKIHVEETEGKILKIKRKKTSLEKVKDADGLDRAHRLVFEAIFHSNKNIVTLKDIKSTEAAKKVQEAGKTLKKQLIDDGIYTKHSFVLRIFVLTFGGILFYVTTVFGGIFGLLTGLMVFLAAIAVIVFGFLMPKRTRRGTELARNVLGFKLFMHTAERYRSQWQEKEHIFAEYLPYAIAFNDTKHWAKVFKDIGIDKNPDWYVSTIPFTSSVDFTKNLNGIAASIVATASPKSSSSGSSGGGFSGGGMGGGGGGSW